MQKIVQIIVVLSLIIAGGCVSGMRGRNSFSSMQKAVESATKNTSPSIALVVLQYPAKKSSQQRGIVISYAGATSKGRKTCTGIILDKKGHVLIPGIVKADDVERVEVWIGDTEYRARIVKSDKNLGMTIVKMDTTDESLHPLSSDTATLKTGEWSIFTLASDEKTDYQVFSHIGMCQGITAGHYRKYVMKNIPRSGNGAPVINMDGDIAGIIQSHNLLVWNDISSDINKLLLAATTEAGENTKDEEEKDGWFGAILTPINKEYAKLKNYSKSSLWITHVFLDSPAADAGFKCDDLITAINGQPLLFSGMRTKEYFTKILNPKVGSHFEVTILRSGKEITISGDFAEKPEPKTLKADDLGITVQSISDVDYINFNLLTRNGVLVTDVRKGGAAATSSSFRKKLIGKYDVITALDGTPTPTLEDFANVLEKIRRENNETVLIQYCRKHTTGFAGLNLKIGKNNSEKGDK